LDEYRGPITRSKRKKLFILEVKIIFLESLQTWQQEMNSPETSIMRRDKEVEDMLQEIKESQDLKIEGG
jgi:hypothetical protein